LQRAAASIKSELLWKIGSERFGILTTSDVAFGSIAENWQLRSYVWSLGYCRRGVLPWSLFLSHHRFNGDNSAIGFECANARGASMSFRPSSDLLAAVDWGGSRATPYPRTTLGLTWRVIWRALRVFGIGQPETGKSIPESLVGRVTSRLTKYGRAAFAARLD